MMRILSLSRPWPWAIFELPRGEAKALENRSWPLHADAVGEPIGIHAAKSWDDRAIPFLQALGLDPPTSYHRHVEAAVVGVVVFDRIVRDSTTLGDQARWFFEKREDGKPNYGWCMSSVWRLDTPVPLRGRQRVYMAPEHVEAAVRAQIGALQ